MTKVPKHATSIALVVVAVALGGYVWWVDRDTISDSERSARPRNVFPAYRRDGVERIELASDTETRTTNNEKKNCNGLSSFSSTAMVLSIRRPSW